MDPNSSQVIEIEEGWRAIKEKALDVLERMIASGVANSSKLFNPAEYMQTYTKCYDMCTQREPHNWSGQLYQRHGESLKKYLKDVALKAIVSQPDDPPHLLLQEYVKRWNDHKIMNLWYQKFFTYLDRYHVVHYNLPKLSDSGLEIFFEKVYTPTKSRVVANMLKMIATERKGESVNRELLKSMNEVLVKMGMGNMRVYTQDFEEELLRATQQHYKSLSQDLISSCSTSQYLAHAAKCIADETNRVRSYMDLVSEGPLLKVCRTELLLNHHTTLFNNINSGCQFLLQNDRNEDLQRMYQLFHQVDCLEPMASIVERHIKSMGQLILKKREAAVREKTDKASDPTFVDALLDLHSKYAQLIKEAFGSHSSFQKAMKSAFDVIINKNVPKATLTTAEMLGAYCDRLLKTGYGDTVSDEQIESKLKDIVQLFSYLQDKDFFAEIHKNYLAKRLLNSRSKSDDLEKSMIGHLKIECGSQFTQPLEGMLNDINGGNPRGLAFKDYLASRGLEIPIGGFEVSVLTTGFWPMYPMMKINVPAEMQKCMDLYTDYYMSHTNNRTLNWAHRLGFANVRANFKKWYDLQVTTLQAMVMLQFNSGKPAYTFDELVNESLIESEVMKKILHSLSCVKHKILLKEPKSKTVKPGDSFSFNTKFKSQQRKIRIPIASLSESGDDKKRVQQDRGVTVDAAVVRIMKSRKVLSHNDLVSEAMMQITFFKADPKLIKRRINTLIDREYLERDPDNMKLYRYKA